VYTVVLGRGEPKLPLLPREKGGGGMRVNLYKWDASNKYDARLEMKLSISMIVGIRVGFAD